LKLLSLASGDPQRAQRMRALILETDLDRLSPREAFLMRHDLALLERDRSRADTLLDAYLHDHPNDLFALTIRCNGLWNTQKLDDAERCFSKLLEIDPTAVVAQNLLGYIRMARGDFEGSEKAFAAYERTAPDQANPHDSLGELLTLRGRYDEAQRAFENAVSIRSDFCASWSHMMDVAFLRGDSPAARAELARAERTVCPPEFFRAQRCRAALWNSLNNATAADVAATVGQMGCSAHDFDVLSLAIAHGAATEAGATDLAAALEEETRKSARDRATSKPWPILAHMEGRTLASRGKTAEAIARFQRADAELTYTGENTGLFKMYNRLVLATLLERAGRTEDAAALRKAVDAVNPRLAARFASLRLALP
ncbi:MAG TPA: hypothetical protein VGF40_17765, partial [Thermoanaerobaculia bacterium]